MHRKYRGFTLVEALVVIAIVVLVGLIIFNQANRPTPKISFQGPRGDYTDTTTGDLFNVKRNDSKPDTKISLLIPGTYQIGKIRGTSNADCTVEFIPKDNGKPIELGRADLLDMMNVVDFNLVLSGDSNYREALASYKKPAPKSKP